MTAIINWFREKRKRELRETINTKEKKTRKKSTLAAIGRPNQKRGHNTERTARAVSMGDAEVTMGQAGRTGNEKNNL